LPNKDLWNSEISLEKRWGLGNNKEASFDYEMNFLAPGRAGKERLK
jgi:hypothetical protein